MLILTRRVGESIVVGDDIVLTVFEVRGDAVRVGIEAPRSVQVHRQEVYDELRRQNEASVSPSDDAVDALSGALGAGARNTVGVPAADAAADQDGASAAPVAPESAGSANGVADGSAPSRSASSRRSAPKPGPGPAR